MPGITMLSATDMRWQMEEGSATVINAPPKKPSHEETEPDNGSGAVEAHPDDVAVGTKFPASLQVRPNLSPQEKCNTIRRVLFLEAQHDNTFHELAACHLQQTRYNTSGTDTLSLSFDAATSFLRIYGQRLWPATPDRRTHLVTVSTVRNCMYWRGRGEGAANSSFAGPSFALDSLMTNKVRAAWRRSHTKKEPSKADELAQSKLAELMKIYFAALLGIDDDRTNESSKIRADPIQLLNKVIAGSHTTVSAAKRKAVVVLKGPPKSPRDLRSSSPDVPLSSLIEEWRSTHRLTEPPAKRLKVANSEQSRKRPALGKIVTSPLPACSTRTEPSPISDEMLTRVQARRMSSTSQEESSTRMCVCPPGTKIPRPRNAYILYSQLRQAQISTERPGLQQKEILKIIGEQWHGLSQESKNEWLAKGEEEKCRHRAQYPNYRFDPNRSRRSTSLSKDGSTSAVVKPMCNTCGGVTVSSSIPNRAGAQASSPTIEVSSRPAKLSNVVRRSLVDESEQHHHLNRPPNNGAQAPEYSRRLPVTLSVAEVTRNQAELSAGPGHQVHLSNGLQLPTPRSSMQDTSPQSAFDRNLALHLSSLPQNVESMPPPARPWPTLPRQPNGYEFPRYGPDVWTPREEEETMSRMGLSGEMGIQQQLKSVDHFKAYEIAAGSLGGLPFC